MDMSWDGSNPGSVASIGPATDPSSLRSSPAASGYTTPATLSPTTTPTKRTSLHGLTAMTSPLVQALQDVVLERGADEIADADVDETAQYDCQCVAGHWAQGCSLWVNYVLLHTTAAFALRGCRHPKPEQMAVSAAIRSSKVEVIALETSAHDLYKTSIEDILADTFILNNEDYILTDAQRDTIRQWLTRQYPESVEKRNLLTSNRMEGRVPHCETVLTSLRYLAKEIKRKPLILVSEDEAVPVERKVELPAKAILDSCLDLKPALSVSKLCCPVCTVCIGPSGSLRHHIELWPGSHTTWSTLDMPNWVPDEVCQRALDAARRALGIRLRDIVLEAAGPTATRSPSPEVTGSSPVGGVDASYKHPLDYWVEDKGVGTLYPSGGLVEKATKADSETKADLNDPDHSAKSLSPVDRE
ncbi:hypothetical protein GGR54DRAFT_623471 [Hypoxylon sp. NC1633]|nr:hypothetical protein GGR54DRAFT_623471 [Hypoxylon sp. NC1633]